MVRKKEKVDMFYTIQIVQAEYQARNARLNASKEVEGILVQAPNIVDRAVLAVRAALTGHRAAADKSRAVYSHGTAVAK
ncbi:MAG TPA: hypothetical protein VGK81_05910 [Anaerolineae bacterium]